MLSTDTFLPVVWVMAITFAVYLGTHAIMGWREKALQIYLPRWIYNRYVWIFLGIFILGMDFWAWGKIGSLFWGIPLWAGYFVILSALQTIAMVYLVRKGY